jgi:hypothetical protein
MKSVQLKKQYEEKHNFKYDVVMATRFDNAFTGPVDFTTIENPKNFYLSSTSHGPSFLAVRHLLSDHYFVSNSDTMSQFADLYTDIDRYLSTTEMLSNHRLNYMRLDDMDMCDKIRFNDFNGNMLKRANGTILHNRPASNNVKT